MHLLAFLFQLVSISVSMTPETSYSYPKTLLRKWSSSALGKVFPIRDPKKELTERTFRRFTLSMAREFSHADDLDEFFPLPSGKKRVSLLLFLFPLWVAFSKRMAKQRKSERGSNADRLLKNLLQIAFDYMTPRKPKGFGSKSHAAGSHGTGFDPGKKLDEIIQLTEGLQRRCSKYKWGRFSGTDEYETITKSLHALRASFDNAMTHESLRVHIEFNGYLILSGILGAADAKRAIDGLLKAMEILGFNDYGNSKTWYTRMTSYKSRYFKTALKCGILKAEKPIVELIKRLEIPTQLPDIR